MRFAKGHGTENDFVILADPAGELDLPAALAARLCDRHAGIGADGVLRAVRMDALRAAGLEDAATAVRGGHLGARAPEWFMDYRNADGSLAEMCGNGIRVFARYLLDHGLAEGPAFGIATRAGVRQIRTGPGGSIAADMGAVSVHGPGRAVVGGALLDGLRISVGNPHLACVVDGPLEKFDLSASPGLDPMHFPAGGNVEIVKVTGLGTLEMRVYERGSGETRSCGTGAVASAVAAAAAYGPAAGSWRVTVPGGTLTVTLDAATSWLTGPAVIVAEGEINRAWLTASR
ncbi:MAG TPA: diaminopimelate epimerase [Streptosporangiaceae bacterium]|jgi:diaminopimelate epimerase|nr:diaminopimelate epimerase [Streptosporangiaceae bacterium]